MKSKQIAFFVCASVALCTTALADEIKCKDGSVIIGDIENIESGIITVSHAADVEGKTKIKQSEVLSIATTDLVFVRTPDKNTLLGKLVPAENGKVKVENANNIANIDISNLSGAWRKGDLSPEEKLLTSTWSYSIGASFLGKTGNTESLTAGVFAEAIRKTADDALKFYVNYNYGKTKNTDGEKDWSKSADDLHCGFDYTNDIFESSFWYVREDLGFDRVKNIRFLSTSAAGLGHKIIDKSNWHLSVRSGLSYRYETYKDYMNDASWDNPDDTSVLGMDFGLHHDYAWSWGKIVTDISYTPAFEDFFGNYIATHESYLEFKVNGIDNMDIRIGMKNEYRSETTASDHLDTTYYAKIVFSWS